MRPGVLTPSAYFEKIACNGEHLLIKMPVRHHQIFVEQKRRSGRGLRLHLYFRDRHVEQWNLANSSTGQRWDCDGVGGDG
jgi:hypothetical protein